MMYWIWILIPLGGILAGAFSEWLKFKQAQLESTAHLSGEVDDLTSKMVEIGGERDRLVERVQNLEAIVTSQMYDAVVSPGSRIPLEDDELPADEQVKRIARRLRG